MGVIHQPIQNQLHKIGQLGRLPGRLLEQSLKIDLPLMKSVFQPLAKSV